MVLFEITTIIWVSYVGGNKISKTSYGCAVDKMFEGVELEAQVFI